MEQLPTKRPTQIYNPHCAYCSDLLDAHNRDREHVIGRRFIPRGKFDGAWNLILNACKACNGKKSNLEDDISAITLQPPLGGPMHNDPVAASEAIRKAKKSISRRTSRPVVESHHEFNIKMPFMSGAGTATFELIAPPQFDEDRAYELAYYQVAGFFFWITYNEERKRGYNWPGDFMPISRSPKSDWGNPLFLRFAESVCEWSPRVLGNTADGYFKVALRKHYEKELWSWALEWNRSFRLIGFVGDFEAASTICETFPNVQSELVFDDGKTRIRSRQETSINEGDDDLLFDGCFGHPA